MVRIEPPKLRPVAIPEPVSPQQITWRPIGEPRPISFAGSNYHIVRKALVSTFGPFPIRLHHDIHLNILFAMKHAAGDGGTAFDEILQALTALPGIELQDL